MSDDDDFGGFEVSTDFCPFCNYVIILSPFWCCAKKAAPTSAQSTSQNETKQISELPEWLRQPSLVPVPKKLPKSESKLEDFSLESFPPALDNTDSRLVKELQEELNMTKLELVDQQTKYLQMQTKHRQEIDDTTNNFNNTVKEFQTLMRQSLAQQRELMNKEFKVMLEQQANEYDAKLKQKVTELQTRHSAELNIHLENKFAEFQERMIVSYESDLQDLDVKVRRIVGQSVREESVVEKARLNQSIEGIERNLKAEVEKSVQASFKNQSEIFKVCHLHQIGLYN